MPAAPAAVRPVLAATAEMVNPATVFDTGWRIPLQVVRVVVSSRARRSRPPSSTWCSSTIGATRSAPPTRPGPTRRPPRSTWPSRATSSMARGGCSSRAGPCSKRTWPGAWIERRAAVTRSPARPSARPSNVVWARSSGSRSSRAAVALPDFAYRAEMADGTVEHELCPVVIAEVVGHPRCPTPTRWTTSFGCRGPTWSIGRGRAVVAQPVVRRAGAGARRPRRRPARMARRPRRRP